LEKIGYETRNYFFDTSFTNSTTQQKLYLLNSSDSTDVALILKDAGLAPLENYIIKVYRYRESSGIYELVENDKTDNFGQIMTHLEENDVKYKIEIYNPSGTLVKTIDNNVVICRSTVLCSQTFIIEDTTNPFGYQPSSTNYTYTFEFNNDTNIFSFVWVDSLDTSSEHRLEVIRHSILNGSTSLCNTTSSLDSGVLTCNVGSDRYSYTASAYRRSGGVEKRIGVLTAKVGNLSSTFGLEGLFWSLILLVSAAIIGIFYPPVAVVLYVGGMFLLGIFDIIYVSPALIIGEIVLGVLFIWSFRG